MSNTPWHENDKFWDDMAPKLFSTQRWENTPSEVDQIRELIDVPESTNILDLPCGTGRHTLEWARRGFKVTGVDRTATYVEQAKATSNKENLDIEWIVEDMRKFVRPDTYNLILNMFTSFGYFEDINEDINVAQNFYDSLKTGGQLIMDILSKEILATKFATRIWHTDEEDNSLFLQEHELSDNWCWIKNRWITIKTDGTRTDYVLEHRLYSAKELLTLLSDVGFSSFNVYGSLQGIPYDQNAKRLIIVATKK